VILERVAWRGHFDEPALLDRPAPLAGAILEKLEARAREVLHLSALREDQAVNPPSGTFVTEQELRELTGRSFASLQIRWLTSKRWPFEIDDFNRPVVLRSVMECKLGTSNSRRDSFVLDEASVG